MTVVAGIVAAVLLVFTVRRYVFWLASLPPRPPDPMTRTRPIAVLVTARNEEARLPRLLRALEALDYPPHLLSFVLVSDGSTDATASLIQEWTELRPRALAVLSPSHEGKAAGLQRGLQHAGGAELVAVLDADTIPRPDALARLAGGFEDPSVGGAGGYPDPGCAHRTVVARYAALERWVFHLVTQAGKDRLRLQPDVIGAICCFRAEALAAVGGFPQGEAAEDILISRKLARAGWRTRWIGEASAREDVPEDLAQFRLQRLRWSRGLLTSGARAQGLEELLVAAGYVDRLAFVAGVALAVAGLLPAWLPAAYAAAPAVVALTALSRARPGGSLGYIVSIPPMAFADIAVTLESVAAQLAGSPVRWGHRPRARQTTP